MPLAPVDPVGPHLWPREPIKVKVNAYGKRAVDHALQMVRCELRHFGEDKSLEKSFAPI